MTRHRKRFNLNEISTYNIKCLDFKSVHRMLKVLLLLLCHDFYPRTFFARKKTGSGGPHCCLESAALRRSWIKAALRLVNTKGKKSYIRICPSPLKHRGVTLSALHKPHTPSYVIMFLI